MPMKPLPHSDSARFSRPVFMLQRLVSSLSQTCRRKQASQGGEQTLMPTTPSSGLASQQSAEARWALTLSTVDWEPFSGRGRRVGRRLGLGARISETDDGRTCTLPRIGNKELCPTHVAPSWPTMAQWISTHPSVRFATQCTLRSTCTDHHHGRVAHREVRLAPPKQMQDRSALA